MPDHIANRDSLVAALRAELVGPSPQGREINCDAAIRFPDLAASYGPWRQAGSGEEILDRDRPTVRYGVGVLYPLETPGGDGAAPVEPADIREGADVPVDGAAIGEQAGEMLQPQAWRDIDRIDEQIARLHNDDSDDLDLSTANAYRPSAMGLSFLAEVPVDATLIVEASGGRYRRKGVLVPGKKMVDGREIAIDRERHWWLRNPVSIRAEFSAASLSTGRPAKVAATATHAENVDGLDLHIELFSRPHTGGNRLLTVTLINRRHVDSLPDEFSLFQAGFSATVVATDHRPCILPYPDAPFDQLDDEEQSLDLLYRNVQTYAVGHGCAADWEPGPATGHASRVRAECLPACETPGITPVILRPDGNELAVPMAPLAGLVPGDDGLAAVTEVIELYEGWIAARRAEIPALEERYRPAAARHLDQCRDSAIRMREGLDYLHRDPVARRAFELANHAILLQQVRSGREPRRLGYDTRAKRWSFSEPYGEPDHLSPDSRRGRWRPFQIAFLLASLRSVALGNAPDREMVELIWFPTGGGKTEAYLGLTAFAVFLRRLRDPRDTGVQVLMRYTLRLLTAQQFQRAAGLFCAMEHLRSRPGENLGDKEFSIGIWLGGSTTPNRRADALAALRKLQSGKGNAENPFIVTRCPWCRAQIGPVDLLVGTPKGLSRVIGYEQEGPTVRLRCSDSACQFSEGLPIYVIDDDVYEQRPSLVIGTVDKFAMLAWHPGVRALFGIGPDGRRFAAPPGLIIQDELHLISGPLGSMVGLYETIIEELCTDDRSTPPVRPKIVSSTATIRRYAAQIRALYGRDQVALFPPSGLDASDSFFARHDRDKFGRLKRGRLYVGVHAPGLGSLQTAQVRAFSALLQYPVPLAPAERDPWWTLLVFFNSLRELGAALSLFQSDVPDYFRTVRNRHGAIWQPRYLNRILELTGRLRSDDVPAAIAALEVESTVAATPVDVCLASNIIEVGVDIDRLSLMAVVGQPKTTAQYIQVTGRVGRRPDERPGLIVTLYGASKPRDRSHFEKFRSYHERLYAQVEPTSVTPFSQPALERALHATLTAYARQAGGADVARSPYPYPDELVESCRRIFLDRVRRVDPAEEAVLARVFDRRAREWQDWQRLYWQRESGEADPPLLREPGRFVASEAAHVSWETPMSMRNVDAECQAEITLLYANDRSTGNA